MRSERFVFIDGLRGFAALAVLGFHFYLGGPLHSALQSTVPGIVDVLLSHGYLGVEVFFVLSGFVIAHSVRGHSITRGFVARFALRRALRLDPAYWMTILVLVSIDAASNLVLHDRIAPAPNAWQLVTNLLYLQGIAGQANILVIAWTLCLEVQFYILYVSLVGLSQSIRKSPLLVLVPLHAASVAAAVLSNDSSLGQVWFIGFWYAFFAGALTSWVTHGGVRERWWWLALAPLAGVCVIRQDPAPGVALATAAAILIAHRRRALTTWLSVRPVQYLGALSYGVYLLHTVVGGRVENMGFRFTGDNPVAALGWFGAALAVTFIAAHLLRTLVEIPGIGLGRRITTNHSGMRSVVRRRPTVGEVPRNRGSGVITPSATASRP
jgi:peptidoglycan/LPS O-acetylase OafA/YrhL